MDIVDCAERAWAWTLDQVRFDADGPWFASGVGVGDPDAPPPATDDRDCLYDGLGGLAVALCEVRLTRPWTDGEQSLADAIVERLTRESAVRDEGSLYVGLAGDATVLRLLGAPAADAPLQRLTDRAPDGRWIAATLLAYGPPQFVPDVVLGNAGIVLAGAWAGTDLGRKVASVGADALLAAAETVETGQRWLMVADATAESPNYSHGTSGVVAALAVAGRLLDRSDLVDAAVRGPST